jgi:hypothetical protein
LVEALLKAGILWVRDPMRSLIFVPIYLIRPTAPGFWVYSATNRKEYKEKKVSGE